MPKAKPKAKKPAIKRVVKTQVQRQSQTVHVHVEKPKPRKKRVSKPKEQSLGKPSNFAPSVSSGLTHMRGQINNEIQQPTIIQQITAPPDPRLEKLDKRTRKIKEYLKGEKGTAKEKPINVDSPAFQEVFQTPNNNSRIVSEKTLTPRKINFEQSNVVGLLNKSKKEGSKSTSIFDMFRSARKATPNVEVTKGDGNALLSGPLLLEYKPKQIMEPKAPEPIAPEPNAPPPATAPTFIQSPKGQEIERELKNIVNSAYQANKNKKCILVLLEVL